MNRGELYRVYKGSANDPKKYRVFAVISRQILIESRYSTVICAPIYTNFSGLSTQVKVGINEGLKHESAIHCDELLSIRKSMLTDYVGKLSFHTIKELNHSLYISVGIDDD